MASGMATRCTACGTVFRVVPDQLRVSEGWVRCGRCSEVFNAAEALLDLDTGTPQATAGEAPRAMVKFGAARPGNSAPAASPPPALADFGLKQPRREREPPQPERRGLEPEPDQESEPMPTMDEAVSRFLADAADPPAAAQTERPAEDFSAKPRGKQPRASNARPSFLRQAEQAARWRQPRVRAALAATVIDSLVVENSGLVRVEKSNVYRLSVALRNRAALEVALPALELSLTDGQGKLVARRVLSARELGVNQATLGAGREMQLQATLQAATAPVAGYTIELFYP